MTNQSAIPEDVQPNGDVADAHQCFAEAFHDTGDPGQLRNLFDQNCDDHSEDTDENHGVSKMQDALPSQHRQENCQIATGADGEVGEQDAQDGPVLVRGFRIIIVITLEREVDGQKAKDAEQPFRQEICQR